MANPTATEIGSYLESHLRNHGCDPMLHYSDVINQFEDLPPLNGAWKSHPLCMLFDELDREDADGGLPFRTAVVVSKKTFKPGPGFFKTYSECNLGSKSLTEEEEISIHTDQIRKLESTYQNDLP